MALKCVKNENPNLSDQSENTKQQQPLIFFYKTHFYFLTGAGN